MRASRERVTPRFSAASSAACSAVSDPPYGYWLKVGSDGRWELKAFREALASGTVALGANRWHKLALSFSGSRIAASIDSVEVKAIEHDSDLLVSAKAWPGWAAAGTTPQFDNFSVREIAGDGWQPRRVNLAEGQSRRLLRATTATLTTPAMPTTATPPRAGTPPWATGPARGWRWISANRPASTASPCGNSTQRIEKYKIQYLDGAQWRDAFSGRTTSECWSASFPPVQSGKVRLLVVSTRNNITPSIFEFAVYDDENSGP